MSVIVDAKETNWSDSEDLQNRVALVIGGSGGIGASIAGSLDDAGCRTIVSGRNPERVDSVVQRLEQAVGFSNCNIRRSDDVDRLFDFVQSRFDALDIVVYCAGIGRSENTPIGLPRAVASLSEQEWADVIDTNLRGAFLVARRAAAIMVAQRSGQIVNISSARGALRGQACGSAYCASKMGALSMFESLASEIEPYGVRVITIMPDAVDTSLIAGTTLAPRGAMQPDAVGNFVVRLLSSPTDLAVTNPILAPFGSRRRKATSA